MSRGGTAFITLAPMLATTRTGPVSLLELQREERRNALDLELCRAIHTAATAEVEAGARVLVITGAGTSFCSGADLDGVYGQEFLEALYGMLHGLAALPVPILAAVNGPAIGAGTQLALACDLRVGDTTARFGVPTARNAMAVDPWTMRILSTIAGGGMARRLMIAAEIIDRDEALQCGLVDRSGTLDETLEWAQEIATLAPLTLAHNKAVLNGAADDEVARSFAACWGSQDVQEAALARKEKRAPVFTGR